MMKRILFAVVFFIIIGLIWAMVFEMPQRLSPVNVRQWATPSEINALGMTWSPLEEALYLGPHRLLSQGVWQRGLIRRVTFQDDAGYHYEALVTCDHPKIVNEMAYIYQRENRSTGKVTYYVACEVQTPPDITRSFRSG
jgi:hypothetical protein